MSDLIKLLKFSVNEKANKASQLMNDHEPHSPKRHMWHGQYMAFSEVYTMLESIERTLKNNNDE